MNQNLQQYYKKAVIPEMKKRFKYRNDLVVPRITKVVVNCGIGRLMIQVQNAEESILPQIKKDLAAITGQYPAVRKARQSISAFKLRQGTPVGLIVTLRGQKMCDFLTRLINIVLPRTRDFRGINLKNFDAQGNLNIGVKEHTVFPEVILENIKNIFGLEITVNTNAKNREEAIELFRLMKFPLKT